MTPAEIIVLAILAAIAIAGLVLAEWQTRDEAPAEPVESVPIRAVRVAEMRLSRSELTAMAEDEVAGEIDRWVDRLEPHLPIEIRSHFDGAMFVVAAYTEVRAA